MSEIEKIETEVKTVASEVKQEVATVAEEVKAEAVKVEKALRIDVSVADKLAVREIENQFLRVKQDEQRIATTLQGLVSRYQATVTAYAKKYAADAEYVWDELTAGFKRVEKAL